MSLDHVGSAYGSNQQPTPFVCLLLKLLQVQPETEAVIEYIKNEEFKYLRALGAMYLRLVGRPKDIYLYLEPLLNDYRKLALRRSTQWELTHMDDFVDCLLHDETALGITLPYLPRRQAMEQAGLLEPRRSALAELLEEEEREEARKEEEGEVHLSNALLEAGKSQHHRDAKEHRHPKRHKRRKRSRDSAERDMSTSTSRSRSPSRHSREGRRHRRRRRRRRSRSPSRSRSRSRRDRRHSHHRSSRRDEREYKYKV